MMRILIISSLLLGILTLSLGCRNMEIAPKWNGRLLAANSQNNANWVAHYLLYVEADGGKIKGLLGYKQEDIVLTQSQGHDIRTFVKLIDKPNALVQDIIDTLMGAKDYNLGCDQAVLDIDIDNGWVWVVKVEKVK